MRDAHAFDDAPSRVDLARYHVPFQDIAGPGPVESALIGASRRHERIGIIGESGTGKSSLIHGSLGPMDEMIAPITLSVAVEREEVVTQPGQTFHFIAREIVRQAEKAGLITGRTADLQLAETTDERRVGRPLGRARRFGLGLLGAQASADLTQQFEERPTIERSAAEALATLDQMLQVIARGPEGLVPVLIFDDSDRWLRGSHDVIRQEFFGRMLPALRELPCALVVAIHPLYSDDRDLVADIDRAIESRIQVPRLPSATALGQVLGSRTIEDCGIEVDQVLEQSALDRLHELYCGGMAQGLRAILKTAHVALAEACDSGADRIDDLHIGAARALLESP